MTDKELAQKILDLVGGEDNLLSVTHCVTRLRLSIKDEEKIQKNNIAALSGVLGVNTVGNQFQVILGGKVTAVYSNFNDLVSLSSQGTQQEEVKGSLVDRFLDTLSGIFVPIIPAIIGAGLLKGILIFLMFYGWVSTKSDTYQLLNIFSDAAFYFIPILLANSTANRFKVNPYIAMSIAGILVHPNLIALFSGENTLHFFGIPFIAASYASSVLPIILGVWIQVYVEKLLKRIIPKILQTILVPLLTILLVSPIVLAILGPLGTIIGNGIGSIFINFYLSYGWLAGVVFGALYPFLVITGMHVGFSPVMIQSLSKFGVDYLKGLTVASNSAQAGATLAVYTKTKNKEFKALAGTAALNAFIGITEPALYGVTSRLKKPLIAVSIGGAIGGGIAGFFKVQALGMGTGPIAGIPLFLGKTFLYFIISSLVASVVGFVLTYLLGFDDIPSESISETNNLEENEKLVTQILANQVISSPLTGEIIPLSDVPDPVFSSKVMGEGIAIRPSQGKVVSPFDGSVELVFETKHALGLRSLDGAEVMIHLGLDTVELKGAPFIVHVQAGQSIKKGDLLMEADLNAIQSAGKEIITPIIITNSHDFSDIKSLASGQISIGQDIIELSV